MPMFSGWIRDGAALLFPPNRNLNRNRNRNLNPLFQARESSKDRLRLRLRLRLGGTQRTQPFPMSTLTIPQALNLALTHHQSGRFAEAEGIYRQILAVEPNHADALHLLGALAAQVGRPEVAVELIRHAI